MRIDDILPTRCQCGAIILYNQAAKEAALREGRRVVCHACGKSFTMSPQVYVIGDQPQTHQGLRGEP